METHLGRREPAVTTPGPEGHVEAMFGLLESMLLCYGVNSGPDLRVMDPH